MMRTSMGWLAVLILGAAVMACGSSPSVENTSGGSDDASSQNDTAAGSEGSAGNNSTGTAGSGSGTASTGSGGGGGAGGGSNVPDCSKPEVLCPKEAMPMNDAACSCVTTKPCAYEVCGEPSPKGIYLATCDGKSWTIQETPCK